MDGSILVPFIKQIYRFIDLIKGQNQFHTERTDEALKAIYAALRGSQMYVVERREGIKQDKEREMKIAELWQSASISFGFIDSELAGLCHTKGSYWMNPENWNDQQIRAAGFDIDQMISNVGNLIQKREKFSPLRASN